MANIKKNEKYIITDESPMYLQLREVIRNKIMEGEYLPGTSIPSENELAKIYGIHRLTVRNTIDILVNEGLLLRIPGKGIFVLGEKIDTDIDNWSMYRRSVKDKKADEKYKLLLKTKREAGPKYADIFNIDETELVYYIKRIAYAREDPISIEEIFIPANVLPELEKIDLKVFSLLEIYDFYNIKIKEANQVLNIVTLDKKDARFLDTEPDKPVFMFQSVTIDDKGRPVDFNRSYTRGDKCNFVIQYHR